MKHRLSDYLHIKNIEFKKGFYRCPNPAHDDSTPSCKLYNNQDGQVLTCMSVCGTSYDIYDVAGLLINSDNFIEQKKEVEATLGIIDTSDYKPTVAKNITVEKPVSIPIEKIDEVYNDEQILHYAIKQEYGDTITGKYICYDASGENVNGVEYRFEQSGRKTVFLIWYNGRTIKWTNPPRLIFGLNEIKDGLPFLIVEGPKTREIAAAVLGDRFNVLTWNGGANNADKVDWRGIVGDSDIYLWPDDDEPGQKAMEKIKEMLTI